MSLMVGDFLADSNPEPWADPALGPGKYGYRFRYGCRYSYRYRYQQRYKYRAV